MAEIDARVLAQQVFPLIRDRIRGHGRPLVVVDVSDRSRVAVKLLDAPPPDECLCGSFARALKKVWERHDPALTAPLIVTSAAREGAEQFVGLSVCPLPWAPAGKPWCTECGGGHDREACPP